MFQEQIHHDLQCCSIRKLWLVICYDGQLFMMFRNNINMVIWETLPTQISSTSYSLVCREELTCQILQPPPVQNSISDVVSDLWQQNLPPLPEKIKCARNQNFIHLLPPDSAVLALFTAQNSSKSVTYKSLFWRVDMLVNTKHKRRRFFN